MNKIPFLREIIDIMKNMGHRKCIMTDISNKEKTTHHYNKHVRCGICGKSCMLVEYDYCDDIRYCVDFDITCDETIIKGIIE